MGASEAVIEEACKENACVEESKYNAGCLSGILIQKLLPAIKQKWPTNNRRIQLQQDGAKSHILDDNEEFKEAVDEIGKTLLCTHNHRTHLTPTFSILVFSELYSHSMTIALPMKKN